MYFMRYPVTKKWVQKHAAADNEKSDLSQQLQII